MRICFAASFVFPPKIRNDHEYKRLPPTGLLAQNGYVVRREDSRSSLFTDPGTPDSMEVKMSDASPFNVQCIQNSTEITLGSGFFPAHITILQSVLVLAS